jgi:hypothetical protein
MTMSTFADWVADYGRGTLDDRLTAAIAEVAEMVRLHDKTGSVTLKLQFAAKGGGVIVTPKVTSQVPESKDGGQFFYVLADGSLSQRDPSQPQLPTMEDRK